ncbi:hypothetical protein SAMN04488029_0863 [Reichenbachiella faecimaris]|uniref:Uncharacterized protein n=1 Tax=Reichenbachiella faecimaris TaxID=692418 RepID=A0A1W2G857_REIFA|nr:hypothetical protein [Reichenbachiella faecimaris]SMD32518.1 hypothetical protein SAMN04488029_0863 [Reichenbachiella faecimaris]
MFSFNLQSPNSNYVLKSGEQIQVNPDGWSELKSIPIRSNLENCFNPIISSLGREVYFLGKTDSVNHLFRISKRDNLYHVFDSTFNEFANITLPVWGEPEKLSFDIPKGHWIVDFAGPKDDFAQFLLLGNKDDTLLYNVKLNWEDDYNKYKFELMRFDDPSGNTFDLKPYLSSIDNIYLGSGYLCFDKWGQIYFSKRGKSTWSWPKKIEVAGFKKNSRLIGFEVSSQDYYTTYLYFHAIDSAGNLGIKHIKKP